MVNHIFTIECFCHYFNFDCKLNHVNHIWPNDEASGKLIAANYELSYKRIYKTLPGQPQKKSVL